MTEASLERWRVALESRGMRISRTKTEYLCINRERERGGRDKEGASIIMQKTQLTVFVRNTDNKQLRSVQSRV